MDLIAPQEFNGNTSDDDFLHKCIAGQSGSTATPPMFENETNSKPFSSKFFDDVLMNDDDEFDEINQQLKQVLLDDAVKPSLLQSFQVDMSSYQSHEKLTKNSRKMQLEYQNASIKDKEYVFEQFLKPNIESLALDKYMHYILEKVIEVGPQQQRNIVLERIFASIHKLIKDLYACKVMQKGLEIMTQFPKESSVVLAKFVNFICLDTQMMRRYYVDRIANQLISKSLEVFEGENLNRLLQVLQQYILKDNNERFELSTDQYGCLIVNKIIDIYPKQFDPTSKQITNEIIIRTIKNSSCLIRRQYANYIIQQILEKGQEQHKRMLMDQFLIKDFVSMSMDKYGSNVAEKAIIYAGPQWRLRLWEEEVSISESTFRKLLNDQYANYPIQRLYEYMDQQARSEFLNLLEKLHDSNFLNHHGQIVLRFAQANFNIKRHAQKVQNPEFVKMTKQQEKNKQIKHQHNNSNTSNNSNNYNNYSGSKSQNNTGFGYQNNIQQNQPNLGFNQQQQLDIQQQYQALMYQQMLLFQQQQQMMQQQQQTYPQQMNMNMNMMQMPNQEQQMMMFRMMQQQQQQQQQQYQQMMNNNGSHQSKK